MLTNMKSFGTIFCSSLYSDLFLQKQGAIPSSPPPGSVTGSVTIFVPAILTDLSWQLLIDGYLTHQSTFGLRGFSRNQYIVTI